MNWLLDTLRSSIGKKLLMAVTGLGFCGFLLLHLAGNLSIFGGREMFNTYAERLHELGLLLTLAEIGLILFAMVHIGTGAFLFYQNFRARPVGYRIKKPAGGSTIGSRTMPYTGLMLLAFVVFHLFNFSLADKTDTTIYHIVAVSFANPGHVLVYLVAMAVAGVHVHHGVWSAFQSLGVNHPQYFPLIRKIGLGFSLLVGAGFSSIPIFLALLS